ncbi:methyltransferase domain-containing protein [Sphingorhabdus sp. EL138]|uniref:class I SAM-dependent methyltransferase n=1 Tax=Sphingorhabdus sp. EL138 TaxID=2073156 RepID=UPI0025F4368B|nr:methyltransferase domain-containing protein [Sphingorhabdus sp. EL138]
MDTEDMKPVEAIYSLGISHNKFGLPLPDGTTYPEWATNYSGERALEFITHFDRVRDRDWEQCSFLDLGCSEGSTTFELSQMGSVVFGVEGREDGICRANVIRSVLGSENTHFSVGNIDDEASYRKVDGVFNAGVLYHLEDPLACLKRTAESARLFVYLDTGHAPRSETEQQNSKFVANFGNRYTLDYEGLELDVVDFAEPKNKSEVQGDGLRRGPRSGIGNDNSVWLSHDSAIALMAKLGFPFHETIKEYPHIPRLRTVFFRTEPRPTTFDGKYTWPLPETLPRNEAIRRTCQRDIEFLRGTGHPVIVLGRGSLLSIIGGELRDAGVQVSEMVVLPDMPVSKGMMNQLTKDKSGFIVLAVDDVVKMARNVGILNRFDYVFTSFALARK